MAGCMSLGLVACSDVWNSPHPEGESAAQKVYYSSFSSRPKHLDPVRAYSTDESRFIDQIYEPPLRYHFLKRPYQVEPNTLAAMPEIRYLDAEGNPVDADSEDLAYSEYWLTIKPGIQYQPHAAFATDEEGNALYRFEDEAASAPFKTLDDFQEYGTRELIAEDYVYGLKRLADPANLSPIRSLMTEFIVGMDTFAETLTNARKKGDWDAGAANWLNLERFDLEGVQVVSKYQYRIRLHGRYPQFKYWLAFRFFSPTPRVVDQFFHQPGLADRNITIDWHPVGTGPFMMTENDPNSVIVLERNPNYRFDPYPSEGEDSDQKAGYLESAGQPMPFLDKAVYRLEKESIPLWTKFLQGYYDRSGISSDSFDQAVNVGSNGIRLSDEMSDLGVSLSIEVVPGTYYFGFNMLDPVVGGQSKPNSDQSADPAAVERARKLRQAIAIAYNEEEFISIFTNGRGEVAMGPIPPGIFGYQSGESGVNTSVFDWDAASGSAKRKPLDVAKRLLAEAGYPDGRDAVTGEPLVLNLDTVGGGATSASQVWMIKQFKKLGIQLNIRATDYNRFQEKIRDGNAQLFRWGWMADYPDAENFLFLLVGSNGQVATGGAGVNSSNYQNPEFDQLFGQMKTMPDSPERMAIIQKMLAIYYRDMPWASAWHPHSYLLDNPWVKNTKAHGITMATLKYLDIDSDLREAERTQRNQPVLWPLILVAAVVAILMVPGWLAFRRRQSRRVSDDLNQGGQG